MDELQQKLKDIKGQISDDQAKLLSLNSIENFLKHYNNLQHYQNEVYNLLTDYFKVMKDFEYDIDKETSTQLGIEYVSKIGYYYTAFVGFKMKMKLNFAIFWGLLIDVLLLLAGILSKVYYVPIATFILLTYWGYLKIFYERRDRTFAVGY